MAGYQLVVIIGNLGADPEVRATQGGMSIANIRVAVGGREKKGDQWVDVTEWFRCVAFGKTAETVAKYTKKGSKVSIQGQLRTRQYEDKEGAKKSSTELVIDRLTLLDSKRDSGPDPDPRGIPDDDFPF